MSRVSHFAGAAGLDRSWLRLDPGADGAGGGAGGGDGGGAAGGAGGEGTAGSGFQAPAGYKLVKQDEYARSEERLRGYDQTYDRLSKAGIKDMGKLEQFAPIVQAVESGRADIRLLTAALSPAEKKEAASEHAKGEESMEAIARRIIAERDEEHALRAHNESRGTVPKFIDEQIRSILGDEATDELSAKEYRWMARGLIEEQREADLSSGDPAKVAVWQYPEGHPLAGKRLAPFGEANTKGVWEALKAHRTARTGKQIGDVGRAAAAAPKRSTVGGDGKVEKKSDQQSETADDVFKQISADATRKVRGAKV